MASYAKVIADSISPDGVRLTTMEVCFHRFVLAEFNTHRVFSRNSASSRAIPVAKQIQRIADELAYPVVFPGEQRGMQGGEEIVDPQQARMVWDYASRDAVTRAFQMVDLGVHKSVTNRLLEPFMWHTVVVTATAWENFFSLRLDADAQPEIRVAAEAMKAAMDASTPVPLGVGDWHLPYVSVGDVYIIRANVGMGLTSEEEVHRKMIGLATRISAARCARTSYLTQDGVRDFNEDLRLYDRLVTDRLAQGKGVHWSPLEHVATPWEENRQEPADRDLTRFYAIDGAYVDLTFEHLPRTGNLLGWRSLRTEVEAINKKRTYR